MTQIRVNVRAAVNAKAIRREQYNGREHIVVPSYTLPSGVVMNEGLYPHDEIEAGYKSLEMTPAPLGHPQVEGEYVSASRPDAINSYHVGAFNHNVKRVGNRIYVEKFIDVEYAKNSENGRKALDAIDKGEPIHTSTGLLLDREMTPSADGYKWIARNMQFDHDAILIGQTGAATPEQGVGMLVNRQLVINSELPEVNESALDDSYGEQMASLDAAVKERYATTDSYAFVMDFDREAAVVKTADRTFKVRYSLEDGNPILGEEVGEVIQKTEYEMKTNRLKGWLQSLVQWNSKQTEPVQANETEEKDMTPEEVQAIVDKALGAVNQTLESVQAENATLKAQVAATEAALAANAESGLASKRAIVAEKLGEVIANQLSGEALDDAVARCSTAAPLAAGFQGNQEEADEMTDYSINAHMKEAK
jgi:hypothetical protein